MNSDINTIIKQTLLNLRDKGIVATPTEYSKEFYEIAKNLNFKIGEDDNSKNSIQKLDEDDKKEKKSPDKLLSSLTKNNLANLSTLVASSLAPSINFEFNENLEKFKEKIEKSPALLFEENTQNEIKKFIGQRFTLDGALIKRDLTKLVAIVCSCLDSAVSKNASGNKKISKFKKEISTLKTSSLDDIEILDFQNRIINTLEEIEDEMKVIGDSFKSNISDAQKLEGKIKELEKELIRTHNDNRIDFLTEVLTRKAFISEVNIIERNYTTANIGFAVVFFDIDYFKKINDVYGHDTGDIVLKTFAKILKSQTRDHDPICRYGGEEFVVLVHTKSDEELLKYLSRIKKIIAEHKFVCKDNKIQITFSAGVANRKSYKNYELALENADKLLYKAKHTGRNKIVIDNGTEI